VTDQGLVKLDMAGGSGTLVLREHSDTIAAGNDGLVETLTGRNANDGTTNLSTVSSGGASQASITGSLILGSEANDAIIADGNTSATATYVKTFGVAPITLDTSNNTLVIELNASGTTTSLSIAAGSYTTMAQLAAAAQDAVDGSAQLSPHVTVEAMQDSASPYGWGLKFTENSGRAIGYSGTFVTDANALNGAAGTVAASQTGEDPFGVAANRSAVDAGIYSNGVDLSVDNTVTIEVIDNVTGTISQQVLTLDSSSTSVSFSDYADLVTSSANASFLTEGFTFETGGTDSSLTLSMVPAGDYTVSLTGTSVTEAFGAPVTATGTSSNMDGYVFDSMDDVVSEMNAEFAAAGLGLVVAYSRGGDTFTFAVTEGRADASNTLSFSGEDLARIGMLGNLTAVGGGTEPTETVRYVSQIDISTRESAVLSMTVVDAALETLAGTRAGLGAVANRLESTISNLMNISENTSESMSRVMDADFAAESTRLARAQILQEASVAMLAQANSAAQSVLKLLQ
jgi:flagellin